MRALVTGVTRAQANAVTQKSRFQMLHGAAPLVRGLAHLGYEVDHRKVELGESLHDYDLAVVFTAPWNSWPANKCGLGALYAIGRLKQCGIPTLIYMEDWRYKDLWRSVKRFTDHPEDFLKRTPDGGYFFSDDPEVIKRAIPFLEQTLHDLRAEWQPGWWGIFSKYAWGDLAVCKPDVPWLFNRLGYLEYSAHAFETMHPGHERLAEAISEKEERWLLATIADHESWLKKLGNTWPVQPFGLRRGETVRLDTEADVALEVARSAGALAPKYHHAGSGWFRVRWINSALGRTVLVGDHKDAVALGGKGGPYDVTVAQVEAMTHDQRLELAKAQQETLWPWLWSWDRYYQELAELIRKAPL